MNSKTYKSCAVAQCTSTSVKTPCKLFFYAPHKQEIRKKWLELAGRDTALSSTKRPFYFCEDHFDLPNDMQNYMQYHVMGSVSKVLTKPGCIPSKFEYRRTSDITEQHDVLGNQTLLETEKCRIKLEEAPSLLLEDSPSGSSAFSLILLENSEIKPHNEGHTIGDLIFDIEEKDEPEFVYINSEIATNEATFENELLQNKYIQELLSRAENKDKLIEKKVTYEVDEETVQNFGKDCETDRIEAASSQFDLRQELRLKTEVEENERRSVYGELTSKIEAERDLETFCLNEGVKTEADSAKRDDLHSEIILKEENEEDEEKHTDDRINIFSKLTNSKNSRRLKEKLFSCPRCDYKAVRWSNVNRHINDRHTKHKIFTCQYCSYEVTQLSALQQHVNARHTKERFYQCQYCNYKATQSSALKSHVNSRHTKEKFYQCIYCNYKATAPNTLKGHINSRHTKAKTYECPYCELKTAQLSNLKRHINSRHTKEMYFLCPCCEYKATELRSLKVHLRSQHMKELVPLNGGSQ